MNHEIDKELLLKHIQKSDLLGREKMYLDELVQRAEWIPCSERLPENAGEAVIVSAKNRYGQNAVFIAFRGYGDFKWHTMDTRYMVHTQQFLSGEEVSMFWEITHWMPLPEPPEKEKEKRD